MRSFIVKGTISEKALIDNAKEARVALVEWAKGEQGVEVQKEQNVNGVSLNKEVELYSGCCATV
jgi:hypothetical protein